VWTLKIFSRKWQGAVLEFFPSLIARGTKTGRAGYLILGTAIYLCSEPFIVNYFEICPFYQKHDFVISMIVSPRPKFRDLEIQNVSEFPKSLRAQKNSAL